MDNAKMFEIIHALDSQGQIWSLCCYPAAQNKKTLSDLKICRENIFYFSNDDSNNEIIVAIKKRKPDYLLIFEPDYNLLNKTSFIYEWGGKHYYLKEDGYVTSRKIKSNIISIDKKICFTFSQKRIDYKHEYETKVDNYWDYLIKSGKKYYNGEMYSLTEVIEDENNLEFVFGKTNYKHLIYSKDHDFRNDFHTCTTASIAIIETKDGYSVLGKMSNDSAFANQYKCIGGALSSDDIIDTQIDMKNMFRREIMEEIGVDIFDSEVCNSNIAKWLLIREKMAFVGLCNIITLNMTREEFQKKFDVFLKKEKEREVCELLFVKSYDEILAIEEQKKADYVDELYGCFYLKKDSLSWDQYKVMYYE